MTIGNADEPARRDVEPTNVRPSAMAKGTHGDASVLHVAASAGTLNFTESAVWTVSVELA
jgi:hypothetical protein